ncbi:FkbM family methyltransferase [Fodinibius sp. AD559]|uniref:FkbM family methyltransferase n=1 Tax=Fodinibius sp. AD559 TaxID=3424179 RepID=UPI00404694A2
MGVEFNYRENRFYIESHSNDYIYKNIKEDGSFYELTFLEYLFSIRDKFDEGSTKSLIIDVGANIGNHAIYFGTYICDYVVAIEPNHEVIGYLQRNLQNNLPNNFSLINKAVDKEKGKGYINIIDRNNLGASKLVSAGTDSEKSIEITTVDEIVARIIQQDNYKVSYMKLDIEGMELNALKGSVQTIKAYHPHLFIEAQNQKKFKEITSFLSSYNYKPLISFGHTPLYHYAYKPSISLRIKTLYLKLRRYGEKGKKYLGIF